MKNNSGDVRKINDVKHRINQGLSNNSLNLKKEVKDVFFDYAQKKIEENSAIDANSLAKNIINYAKIYERDVRANNELSDPIKDYSELWINKFRANKINSEILTAPETLNLRENVEAIRKKRLKKAAVVNINNRIVDSREKYRENKEKIQPYIYQSDNPEMNEASQNLFKRLSNSFPELEDKDLHWVVKNVFEEKERGADNEALGLICGDLIIISYAGKEKWKVNENVTKKIVDAYNERVRELANLDNNNNKVNIENIAFIEDRVDKFLADLSSFRKRNLPSKVKQNEDLPPKEGIFRKMSNFIKGKRGKRVKFAESNQVFQVSIGEHAPVVDASPIKSSIKRNPERVTSK